MKQLLQNYLLIGGTSFLVFLVISILLAYWAVKPVATWEQQRKFVADASHELKTPLTVILSNAHLLSGNGEDANLRERLTANILTVSEQMRIWWKNCLPPHVWTPASRGCRLPTSI